MNTNDNIGNVLRNIARRNPALASIANSALESVSSGDYSDSDLVETAKRIAIRHGIDIHENETDPDMLLTSFSDAIIRLAEKVQLLDTPTDIEDTEPTEEEIDAAYAKVRQLRLDVLDFATAETRFNKASGFWDRIPTDLHYIYADMLVDMCQKWQVNPLKLWSEKARG